MKTWTQLALLGSFLFIALAQASVAPLSLIEGQDLVHSRTIRQDLKLNEKAATAVVFLSARCPCSNSHEATLDALSKKFPHIAFLGVHSNTDEPLKETLAHFKESPIQFPVVQDPDAKVAQAFGAFKTPHVYLIASNGEILYQGGVDDSHYSPSASQHYLEDALVALQNGKKPNPAQTRTLGCIIKR